MAIFGLCLAYVFVVSNSSPVSFFWFFFVTDPKDGCCFRSGLDPQLPGRIQALPAMPAAAPLLAHAGLAGAGVAWDQDRSPELWQNHTCIVVPNIKTVKCVTSYQIFEGKSQTWPS